MMIDTNKLAITSVVINFEGGMTLTLSAEKATEVLQRGSTVPAPEPVISAPEPVKQEQEAPVEETIIYQAAEPAPVFEEPVEKAPQKRTGVFSVYPETTVKRVANGYDVMLLFGQTDKKFRVRIPDALLSDGKSGDLKKRLETDLKKSPDMALAIYYVVEEDEAGKYCRAVEWTDLA